MRKITKLLITGLLLLTVISAVDAQRGMRRWADSSTVKRPGREMRQAPPVQGPQDSLHKGMRPALRFGYGDGRMIPGGRGFRVIPPSCPSYGFGPWYFHRPGIVPGPQMYRHFGRDNFRLLPPAKLPPGQQAPFIYRIPDLTEKQKKEIDNLREEFKAEADKFREENRQKMEEMRKSHLEKIKNLLTPEQKKWLEERIPAMPEDKKI